VYGKTGESPALARNREQGLWSHYATAAMIRGKAAFRRMICKPGDRPEDRRHQTSRPGLVVGPVFFLFSVLVKACSG